MASWIFCLFYSIINPIFEIGYVADLLEKLTTAINSSDYAVPIGNISKQNATITRFRLQYIHPPCLSCNQYNSEVGVYLGPVPEPDDDVMNYYYCYPSHEDQYHIISAIIRV